VHRIQSAATLVLVGFVLSSCVTAPAPTPTPTAAPATLPPPAETSTPFAPLPPTNTDVPTLTSTAAPSATTSPSFADLKVLNFETGSYGARMILTLPGVSVPYSVTIAGIPYSCTQVEGIPDRMGCLGSQVPPPDKLVSLVFLDAVSREVVYQTTITLPSQVYPVLRPTRTHSNAPPRDPSCPPVDQTTVQCALECRISEGAPCLAATCWDACGYAFSVATCPESMEPPFVWCTAEQEAEQRALHGIP